MSEKKREEIFKSMQSLRREGKLHFSVALVGAQTIDRIGITRAVALGIKRAMGRLSLDPATVDVKLDGLLRAPKTYAKQRTIVRGDETELEISLASIAAKVTRDRHMVRLSKKYPHYGFEVHKGYGTKSHSAAIRKHGISDVHRALFTRNLRVKE